MKKSTAILIILSTCACPHLLAGVVLEMVTKSASGKQMETSKIYAESGKVRIDNVGGKDNSFAQSHSRLSRIPGISRNTVRLD